MSETLMIANIGRSDHQAEPGKCSTARQVVQPVPTSAGFLAAACNKRGKSKVKAPTPSPITPSALAPAIRSRRGIRRQTDAAHSANALHTVSYTHLTLPTKRIV